jgi:hypothetical protein
VTAAFVFVPAMLAGMALARTLFEGPERTLPATAPETTAR